MRVAAALMIGAWGLLCVVGGGINSYAWLFSDHVVAQKNENWLQLNPLSMSMVVAAVLLAMGKRPRWTAWAGGVLLGLSVLGWVIKVFPGMIQPNVSILLLATPIHLGVLVGIRAMTRRPI